MANHLSREFFQLVNKYFRVKYNKITLHVIFKKRKMELNYSYVTLNVIFVTLRYTYFELKIRALQMMLFIYFLLMVILQIIVIIIIKLACTRNIIFNNYIQREIKNVSK